MDSDGARYVGSGRRAVAACGRSRSAAKPQPKFTRLTYQQGYLSNARFAKDGQTVVYSAQWNSEPLQVYTVRMEFPQSTKVDLPSATLLALSAGGDMELAVDPGESGCFSERHHGASADGRRYAAPAGEGRDRGGLCARRQDAGGGPSAPTGKCNWSIRQEK